MSQVVAAVTDRLSPYTTIVKYLINRSVEGWEPWQIILFTSGSSVAAVWFWQFCFGGDEEVTKRIRKALFRTLRRLPPVRAKIDQEMQKTYKSLRQGFSKSDKGQPYVHHLPDDGLSEDAVLLELRKYQQLAEVDWKQGACSGTVYSGDDHLTQLMSKVYSMFAWTNPLHADVFPDVRKMEAEVVRMTCAMFNGGPKTCGSMSSGGTESILLACKAYRDLARSRGISHPEMIVPVSAHAAFDKAAQYFCIRMIHTPVDSVTGKADVNAMRKRISGNTCMMVGSAPSFPHGVIDPISEIAKLGVKYNVPVHVDSCLGGFLIPFMEKAGYPIPPVDFRLPGVTSISADTHKYGYAPKGSSVIMYRNADYRKFQYFVATDWPGGIYASPTFSGSRSGAVIAACWATMMHIGEAGYVSATQKVISAQRYIESELRLMPDIHIMGQPQVSVVSIGSDKFNVYRLSDGLSAKGWNLNALQFPASVHLCVTLVHTKPGIKEKFVNDVRDVLADIRRTPNEQCSKKAAMYGQAQSLPDRSLVGDVASLFFDAYYSTESDSNGKA